MNSISGSNHPMIDCPCCGASAEVSVVRQTLEYATPRGPVDLLVDVPHVHCASCGFDGFGEAGERARTEAIYRYHDRATPWEIASLRERLGMSQRAFADYIGVGHASIERWESGETMQSQSMDNLITLLSATDAKADLDRLKSTRALRNRRLDVVTDLERFRALSERECALAREKAQSFRLRG